MSMGDGSGIALYKLWGRQAKPTGLRVLVFGMVMMSACIQTFLDPAPKPPVPVLAIHHFKIPNAAGTGGKLILHNGCVTLKVASGVLEMLAWPSDFTLKGSPQAVRVVDGEDHLVAAIGQHVELSGGPIGPGEISTTDNHILPSKCLTDHMFAVDREPVQMSSQGA